MSAATGSPNAASTVPATYPSSPPVKPGMDRRSACGSTRPPSLAAWVTTYIHSPAKPSEIRIMTRP